jgi:P-type conjugative transfer protein TrbJ
MKMLTPNMHASSITLLLMLASHCVHHEAKAAAPVIDASNLSQNVVTAVENVAHTLKQIEQYKTQLQQYENMIQNTAAPTAYIWDKATTTMGQLRGAIDTMNYYKTNLGSIDAYLGKFKDTTTYRNSPCFSSAGCTPAQRSALNASQQLGSEAQKKATDALFRGLDQQQNSMESDARQLERLQSSAQGATGQMQAIGFANQLASQQANQLLQIRALLIAQQNAIATRNQVLADREALEAAADEQFRKGTYRASPARTW